MPLRPRAIETPERIAKRVLLVVDAQREFLDAAGAAALPTEIATIANAYDTVIATRSVNPPGSPWRALLDWNGLQDPDAIALAPEIERVADAVLDKARYSAAPDVLDLIGQGSQVDVCGLDTDACVLATSLGLFDAGVDVRVLSHLCASSGGTELHEAGLMVLRRQLGTRRVLDEDPRPPT